MIPINILSQPNDVTCGPTCLHAVYQYYSDKIPLETVINEVAYLENGGTLAVHLASHALRRGYKAALYTYNLNIFDPTWFSDENVNLIEKLKSQKRVKHSKRIGQATDAYIGYLGLGGKLLFNDLTPQLLNKIFRKGAPILAGLSSTYLYQVKREYTGLDKVTYSDDVKGYPSGHFVVLCGYDEKRQHLIVADPYEENPISVANYYAVNIHRLINSIMLGIITYDANILI